MRFQCPECHGIVAIDDADFGEPVGCGHCGEVVTVPKTRFSPGVMINDFIVRDTLGHGGMGTVYLAHQFSLDRPVALKILMEQFSTNSEFIVDFVKEARAAASLNHPNIVQSYAVGEEDGIYFFAMEYVEGKTLKQLMDTEGNVPVDRALNIIQQVAEALDFAWKQKQLVHRDIKPDNIMLTHRGVAKLADLGLARMAHETLDDDDDLVMGTPQYICPEQLLGQPMDVRGDIYSLGATMFHAITGEFPFDGRNAAEIARKHLQEPMPDPQSINPNLPSTICWVLAKMMAKKIEDRYEDAHELAIDLGYILKGEKPVGYSEERPGSKPSKPSKTSQKRPKTKGKVRLGTATRMTPAAAPAAAAPAAGLVTSDRSSSSRIAAANGEATTSGMTRRTKIIVTSRKTGATTTAMLAGDEPKSKGSTTTFSTAGTSTRTGTRPAAPTPPKQSNLAMNMGLAVIALLLVVMIGGGAVLFMKRGAWSPSSTEAVADLYLAQPHVSQLERDAYDEAIPYFGQAEKYANNEEKLIAGENTLGNFVTSYPESLFSIEPDGATDYDELFQTPWYARGKIDRLGPTAAGEVLKNLVEYQETYIRFQRAKAKGDHDDYIEGIIEGEEEKKRLEEALAAIDVNIEERAAEIQKKYQEYDNRIAQKRAILADEQRKVRKSVLIDGADHAFDRAIAGLADAKNDLMAYPLPLDKEIPIYKTAERNANETNVVINNIAPRHPGVPVDKLIEYHRKQSEDRGFRVEMQKFDDLITKDRAFYAERQAWFDKTEAALAMAKEYYTLFLEKPERLTGQRIPLTTGQKIRVGKVKDGKIELEEFTFDPKTTLPIVIRSREMEVSELPPKYIIHLAGIAWGGEDIAGLQIRQAAYFIYSANHGAVAEASNSAKDAMHDMSGFLAGELAEMEGLMIEVICLQKLEEIGILIRQAEADPSRRAMKVRQARHIYEQLNQQYGETPGFQNVKQQMLDLIPGSEPAGAEG